MNKRIILAVSLAWMGIGSAMSRDSIEFEGTFFSRNVANMIWRADLSNLNKLVDNAFTGILPENFMIKICRGGHEPRVLGRMSIFELAYQLTLLTHDATKRHVDKKEIEIRTAIFDRLMSRFEKDIEACIVRKRSRSPESPQSPSSPVFGRAPGLIVYDEKYQSKLY